jgi:uncharacterized membrane protein
VPESSERAPLPRVIDALVGLPAVEAQADRVHRVATWTHQRFGAPIGAVADLVGHPVHPPLTDLPIGFWTSAWVLDLVGGDEGRRAARLLIGAGVLCAIPTIVTGLHDAGADDGLDRRVVAAHAAFNGTATAAYAWSWSARRHGRWGRGVVLAMVGSSLATAGGILGGQLAFGAGAGAGAGDDAEPEELSEA